MKKFALLLLLCYLFISTKSNAQLIRDFGFKVAYTSAHQTFDYKSFSIEMKRRPGINIAAYAEWLNLPIVSLITQIEYAQRGMQEEFVRTENDLSVSSRFTADNRLDYLSIPVLLKISIPSSIISPYVLGGPRWDLLLTHRSDYDFNSSVYDDFKKGSVGASVGAGLQFTSVLPMGILIEARYNFDLSDSYSTESLKVRNNAYDIWLGVAF